MGFIWTVALMVNYLSDSNLQGDRRIGKEPYSRANPLPVVRAERDWLGLLREHAATGTRICSVGSGSFLLAEAGLLEDAQP